MKVLFSNEERKTTTHSSIDQYHKFIATYERGGWTPIEFDNLDYIKCIDCKGGNKYQVVSHPIIIEFDDEIGYHFPIEECGYIADDYVMFDRDETELLPLPEFYGDGFYESHNKDQIIPNFDNGTATGVRNNFRLKIGMSYTLADDILPASDPE